jgi:GT2 family glycosyltransferase
MNYTINIVIAIVTYNRYDLLDELLESIKSQTHWPKEVIISDNGIGYIPKYKYDFQLTIIKNSYNYGTCRGLNQVIKLYPTDDILFLCDDNYFIDVNSFKLIIDRFEAHTVNGGHLIWCNNWAAFIATSKWVKAVGLFDENIWPCYYEDSDMVERIRKKASGGITHMCTGFKTVNMTGPTSNWEETEVIGNKRGTVEKLISPTYPFLLNRSLLYFNYKWKDPITQLHPIHNNTLGTYVDAKDVNLFEFEIGFLKKELKTYKIQDDANKISPFIDFILNLKKLDIKTITEHKVTNGYTARALLHLKPIEYTLYTDAILDTSNDIIRHLNYLFNYNITLRFRTVSDIEVHTTDLLVINGDKSLDAIILISAKYLLIFGTIKRDFPGFECIDSIYTSDTNLYLYKDVNV